MNIDFYHLAWGKIIKKKKFIIKWDDFNQNEGKQSKIKNFIWLLVPY